MIGWKKYDGVTRALHHLLAAGVVVQLTLSQVMRVPPGPGQGVRDWRREAFEIHARLGLAVALLCALHWIWLLLPRAVPGAAALFPWWRREGRVRLADEARELLRGRIGSSRFPSTLASSVHGAGLVAVTISASSGLCNYLGYFLGVGIPREWLHRVSLLHIWVGWALIVYLVGHGALAVYHLWVERRLEAVGSAEHAGGGDPR